ncbi:Kinesin motor domain family protein [Leishmania donovani]|uniref:Kinesin motor domain family protein n=1 Tax=Leishmania donovani TaxID=5661 RepID=A0A504XIG6_LEIDO|nr:Kinesin motor domain family protein [Leishmania donovani]
MHSQRPCAGCNARCQHDRSALPSLMSQQDESFTGSSPRTASVHSEARPHFKGRFPFATAASSLSEHFDGANLYSGAGATNTRDNFRVAVRVRPPLHRELHGYRPFVDVVQIAPEHPNSITLCDALDTEDGRGAVYSRQSYTFDRVYAADATQEDVYELSARPAVLSVLEGYNATLMAYGQTGTGKTYTMEGFTNEEERGIIPRAVEDVFRGHKFLVRASYMQIYNERGVYVDGLSEWIVRTPEDVYGLIAKGTALRATSATKLSELSSRSHAIFTIVVEAMEGDEANPLSYRFGKLNIVDLAGSEKIRLAGVTGQRLEETKNINKSLHELGNVISALAAKPARTAVDALRDSLGGNCKTTLIACISPALESYAESLSTLMFANRAKNIQNHAVVNEGMSQATLLRAYEQELQRLRQQLQERTEMDSGDGNGLMSSTDTHLLLSELEEDRRRAEADRQAALAALEKSSVAHQEEMRARQELESRIRELEAIMREGGMEGNPRTSQEYAERLLELDRERQAVEEDKEQVERYKHLLLKQRDIMLSLTTRLNDRDETILLLQEEVDAYDQHVQTLEEELELLARQGNAERRATSPPPSSTAMMVVNPQLVGNASEAQAAEYIYQRRVQSPSSEAGARAGTPQRYRSFLQPSRTVTAEELAVELVMLQGRKDAVAVAASGKDRSGSTDGSLFNDAELTLILQQRADSILHAHYNAQVAQLRSTVAALTLQLRNSEDRAHIADKEARLLAHRLSSGQDGATMDALQRELRAEWDSRRKAYVSTMTRCETPFIDRVRVEVQHMLETASSSATASPDTSRRSAVSRVWQRLQEVEEEVRLRGILAQLPDVLLDAEAVPPCNSSATSTADGERKLRDAQARETALQKRIEEQQCRIAWLEREMKGRANGRESSEASADDTAEVAALRRKLMMHEKDRHAIRTILEHRMKSKINRICELLQLTHADAADGKDGASKLSSEALSLQGLIHAAIKAMDAEDAAAAVVNPMEASRYIYTYRIFVSGRVQGVFYRKYTALKATELGILAEGTKEQIGALEAWCHRGSPKAQVTAVDVEDCTQVVPPSGGAEAMAKPPMNRTMSGFVVSRYIKVAVRCRPLFGQERPAGGLDIQSRRILLDSKTYDPDFTFSPTSTQEDVFQACRPILQCVKEGMNGTIMVYGQTGTGKTYTMLGSEDGEQGLVHKVVANMLEHVQRKIADGAQCALTLSMIEIYNERLTDMLSPNGEEEVTLISGFPRFTHKATLCRVNDAIETIQRGLSWRHTAATLMNERSSRSHVVFIFDMEEYNAFTEQTEVAHLFMIDLAGSESLKKSQASGATRPSHVPYRDSKLTELLQDSIGGTARTLMIACISSVGRDIEETKSTLLYAVKARSIRNAANTEKEKLLVRLRSMEERVNERGGYYVTKEEHEQTQEMAESYDQLKEAVEQLMQDRQSSDARQHIWESQVKVLKALLVDKEAELQNFKEVYHEALKRFEHQAAALQGVIRGGVAEAKDAVKTSFADNYARLQAWRTELLNSLEEPVPTTLPPPPLSPACCSQNDAAAATAVANEEEVQRQKADDSAFRCPLDAVAAMSPERRSCPPPPSQAFPSGGTQSLSQTAGSRGVAGPVPDGSPSRTAVAAAAVSHPGRAMAVAAPYSARGSTTSSLQRGSVTSGAPSASVSPTRRAVRPRCGGGGAAASNGPRRCPVGNSNGTGALRGSGAPPLSSPPLGACPPPPLTPLPATAVTDVPAKDGSEEYCGSTLATSVMDASAPLLVSRTTSSSVAPPAWSAVMAEYDAQCLRTVRRLNKSVDALLSECLKLFTDYKEHAERAELKRQRGVEEVCQRLRTELDSSLKQLQRVEAVGERDVQEARERFSDRLRLRAKMPSLADAAPFQLAVRDACAEVIRHATHFFPHASTPADAEAALDVIVRNVQRCSATFTLQALGPLSSSAVSAHAASVVACGTTTSSSSAASSPIVGRAVGAWGGGGGSSSPQLASFVPMPPLTATLPRESPAAAPLCSLTGSPGKEEVRERGSVSGHLLQGSRGTMHVSASQQQQQSARPSSLRGSATLTTMPVNCSRGGDGRRGGSGSNLRPTTHRRQYGAIAYIVPSEPQQTLPPAVTDALITYSLYEQVPHAELLKTLLNALKRAQHGDAVLSSDDLFLPLKAVRRALAGVQQFPLTTAELKTLKRDVEVGVVRDIMRLSTDDLSSADVGLLWGCATQCSQWDCVEELLRHFPLSRTLSLQSASEYRDLLIGVCTPQFVSQAHPRSADGEDGGAAAPAEKDNAAPTLAAAPRGGGSLADSAALEERDMHAIACVMCAATLEMQCDMPADSALAFPFSAAEWAQYVGGGDGSATGSSGTQCVRPSTIGGLSLPVWYRRMVALHQRCVPDFVRASFAAAVADDLRRLYQRIDTESLETFFLSFLPLVIAAAPRMDCRTALRGYHNDVMSKLFCTTPSASSATSGGGDRAAATGRRGKWAVNDASVLAAPASGTAAASFALSADMVMRVMLAEVCIQEKGKPLPEAHVPAMESMLRTVVGHLRRHLRSESRSRVVPQYSVTAAEPPASLWKAWNSHRTSLLAIVLSEVQERMSGSAGQGSASTVMNLAGQGLQLLRPLISMEVIDERGTARMVTNLLSSGRGAALEIGGAAYEAELQSFALKHVQDGFARTDVAAIVQTMEKHLGHGCNNGGAGGDAKVLCALEGLKAAELTLPLRSWS